MEEKNEIIVTEEVKAVAQVTPMDLIDRAQSQNASIEQMQQLFELQLRYEENEARKAYNAAMSSFRETCPTINKTRKAHNSKYAGLGETTEVVNPLLANHGLSYRWDTNQEEQQISVTCTVTHVLGHKESTTLSAAPDTSGSKNSIQAIGSTVAYLERYTLFAILGLASREMDDDGNGAKRGNIKTIDDEQLANIDSLLTELDMEPARLLKRIKVDAICNIPADWYENVVDLLEKQRGQ